MIQMSRRGTGSAKVCYLMACCTLHCPLNLFNAVVDK